MGRIDRDQFPQTSFATKMRMGVKQSIEGTSMTTLKTGLEPAEFPGQRGAATDGNRLGPMSQQAASGAHGYDIHPQKFVRLVGCHQAHAAKYEAAERPHRTAA